MEATIGKRSHFERRDRDAYPTPRVAVLPLMPHLRGVRTFAEPCCGNGDLVNHLESHGLHCLYRGDIATGQDALALESYGGADAIITNPPWKRPILHPLIRHFQKIAPTWLLLDQDWACTKQAVPYLACCTDILAIGRQIWIPGTGKHGFDNAAWYRFDSHHAAGPIFHAYRSAPAAPHAILCGACNTPYRPQRSSSKFCSDTCRQRAHRSRLSVTHP
jgi:hypothetical protein